MDDDDHLSALNAQRLALEDEIATLDLDIKHAERAALEGKEVGRWLAYVGERSTRLQGLFFDLGKVTARMEDLQERIRVRHDHTREAETVNRWQAQPSTLESNLDWLNTAVENAKAAQRTEPAPTPPPQPQRSSQDPAQTSYDRNEPDRDR